MTYNMHSISNFPIIIPRTLIGKWRMTMQGWFPEEPDKIECVRSYFDLVEE